MSFLKKLLLWVGAIALIAIVIYLLYQVLLPQIIKIWKESFNYQAVFMQNGQVYFGRLSRMNSDFVKLKDVFYLQTNQEGGNPVLVEFGTAEAYGPKNFLYLNSDQISMIQDLKKDSQIVKAITDYKMSK